MQGVLPKLLSELYFFLHISVEDPHIVATPDALIKGNRCGERCLEVKCPFCVKDQSVFEAMSSNKNFCLTNDGQETRLIRTNPYFYQVQAQLFSTNRQYCDFFIWAEKDWYLERITFEAKFFDECIVRSRCIFFKSVVVELLGKFIQDQEPLQLKHVCCEIMNLAGTRIVTAKAQKGAP